MIPRTTRNVTECTKPRGKCGVGQLVMPPLAAGVPERDQEERDHGQLDDGVGQPLHRAMLAAKDSGARAYGDIEFGQEVR